MDKHFDITLPTTGGYVALRNAWPKHGHFTVIVFVGDDDPFHMYLPRGTVIKEYGYFSNVEYDEAVAFMRKWVHDRNALLSQWRVDSKELLRPCAAPTDTLLRPYTDTPANADLLRAV